MTDENKGSKMQVLSKIIEVMKDVDYLQKDGVVAYKSTRYKYLSEEKVTTAIRKSMIKNKIIMFPILMEESQETVKTSGGSLISRIRATFRIQDTEDDSYIDINVLGYGLDSGDKGIYKAMTGAFKYAQRETFMIPTGDDPDHISSKELNESAPVKKITKAQQTTIEKEMKSAGIDEPTFCKAYKISEVSELPSEKYAEAVKRLKAKAGEND